MTDQWDRFAAGAEQSLHDLGYSNNVDVFVASESFTQGEGWEISYPSTADQTITGAPSPPDVDADRDRGGTTREADLIVDVPSDAGVAWTDSGESGEALTRINIDQTDETYEVVAVAEQFDGLDRLDCVEVDT